MATVVRRTHIRPEASNRPADVATRCSEAIAALQARASAAARAGMTRFAIPNDKALGIGMRDIQSLARSLGRDHALAEALWRSDVYEARMLACYVAEPARVDAAQMDRWVAGIDNWAHCDTVCFALFDRSPLAWEAIERWARRDEEFVRRGAFALLASLSLHDRSSADAPFLHGLALIEAAAEDERNFVKKAVNWALRSLGRRNATLHAAAVAVARRLAAARATTPRWIGKDALRELTSAAVFARLAAKAKATAKGRRTDMATPAVKARSADTTEPTAKTATTKAAAAKAAVQKVGAKKIVAKKAAAKKGGTKKVAAAKVSPARPGATKAATK